MHYLLANTTPIANESSRETKQYKVSTHLLNKESQNRTMKETTMCRYMFSVLEGNLISNLLWVVIKFDYY